MASTITLPVFGSSPTQRQDRNFTPSGPATRTFLPYKVSFSGGAALDPALPARKLRSLIGYSSHTEPVSLHSGNSHFLRKVLVHSLTPQVESSGETNSKTTFEPEYLDPPKETLNIGVLEVKTSSKPATPSKKGRNPKLLNSLASKTTTLDYSQILKYPIVTEAGMKNILQKNTLVFAVDKRADKTIIKDSASKIFKIKIKKVNTSILPDGTKKAFLILAPDQSAVDVAKRIKVI